jgi:flagellar protein FlaG
MSNITQLTTVPADLIGAQALPTQPPQAANTDTPNASQAKADPNSSHGSPSENPEAQAPNRLVITQGNKTGVYIYTILDRATGQVLVQIPREEVLRIAARPDYSAGSVLDTKV